MKKIMIALALAVAPVGASALGAIKEAGVGVIAGDPIGGTAKLWFDDVYAMDVGVGFSGSAVLWGDFMYHAWNLLPPIDEGRLGLYLSAGPRIETASDTQFGIRTMVGATWRLSRQPLEVFAEAGPVFRMTPAGRVNADGGVGIRLYLGSAR
ncbi:MAG: hypothetical protein NDJ72_00330 [Elusimicrobia bacterium]|nr:hypothetical protein [Elusimicrobiota bacterium]